MDTRVKNQIEEVVHSFSDGLSTAVPPLPVVLKEPKMEIAIEVRI